jgi:NAD(P)-dependent dehydrogenase (short-subunit alcohol dehydrogenase family)
MMNYWNFTKDLTWSLATLPMKIVFGGGNHMHSNVLRKINPMVIITGCDSGVGMLTALHLQTNGFQVFATCQSDEGVAKLRDKVHTVMKVDVTRDQDLNNMYRRVTELMGRDNRTRLWALINNAATHVTAPIDWLKFDDFRRLMEVNYLGAVHMTKMFLPLLKNTPSSRIINICGFSGPFTPASMGAYTPTKQALEAFSEQLSIELQQFNVHVVVIEVPKLRTPMVENVEEAARQYYMELPAEVKNQYPRDEVERYFHSLGESMRGSADDPIRGVRMIVRAIRAEKPQFKYAPARWFAWLVDSFMPLEVKHSFYRFQPTAPPKPIAPPAALPTAAA